MRSWLFSFFLLIFFLPACKVQGEANTIPKKKPATPDHERVLPVKAIHPFVGSISSYILASTVLEPWQEVEVLAKREGLCQEVLVEEGQGVKKGQLLARLENDKEVLEEREAGIQEQHLKNNLTRAEQLWEEGLLSREDYEKVKFDYEKARIEWLKAKLALEETLLVAPSNGTITEKDINPGTYLTPNMKAFKIEDLSRLLAYAYVPEKELPNLREGQKVLFYSEALKDQFEGSVKSISPVVDPESGTIKVTLKGEKDAASLPSGLFVQAKLITSTHQEALLVPKKALVNLQGQLQQAFLVKDGHAKLVSVTTGLEEAGAVEVLEGINKQDLVIIEGHMGLEDNSKIKVVEIEPWPEATPSFIKPTPRE